MTGEFQNKVNIIFLRFDEIVQSQLIICLLTYASKVYVDVNDMYGLEKNLLFSV